MMPRVLTIAGSDSSGGAGIQQDFKVFHALGVWGVCAVTSITAQSPSGIAARADCDPALVVAQIRACVGDGVAAAKTGMLATAAIIEAVAELLAEMAVPLVVDPVVAAGADGASLLDDDALDVFRTKLLPLADCVTPNAPEAELLTGIAVDDLNAQRAAARALIDLGARAAVITGGHLPGPDVVDLLAFAGGTVEISGPRIPGGAAHGTGCTFSAALAAMFALGVGFEEAARRARKIVEDGLRKREADGLAI